MPERIIIEITENNKRMCLTANSFSKNSTPLEIKSRAKVFSLISNILQAFASTQDGAQIATTPEDVETLRGLEAMRNKDEKN